MSTANDLEKELTPREIVRELDKYIIGQDEAKKAVAVALRNRWRRKNLPDDMRDEVAPKNIIMMGPTGCGKTEIARRLAKLVSAPFIKVEATKYTEVGYVGRDVESMVRDLVNIAVNDVRAAMLKEVEAKANEMTEERLIELIMPSLKEEAQEESQDTTALTTSSSSDDTAARAEKKRVVREQLRKQLAEGKYDDTYVEIKVKNQKVPVLEIMPGMSPEDMDAFQSMIGNISPNNKKKTRKMTVREARRYLFDETSESLIDMDKVVTRALENVETMGIIVLDEIDKIASPGRADSHDVARHGVQRDLLPVVEGTSVHTRHGPVKTDHILFIAAGAFHHAKPSDLIPELQGRFPIRVELKALTADDFKKILTQPKNALTRQYIELMKTERVVVEFDTSAIEFIAATAFEVNSNTENIGARRLHTIMEKIIEDVSFAADEHAGKKIVIDDAFCRERLKDIVKNKDLSRYIL